MSKVKLITAVFIIFNSVTSLVGLDTIHVLIKTDDTPLETSWEIVDDMGSVLFSDEGRLTEPNKVYTFDLEVEDDLCTRFEIKDAGLNGFGAGGYYGLRRGLFWYANFERDIDDYNFHIMGDCDEGKSCDNPMPANALLMLHPGTENFWYTITTEVNTYYDISTCLNRDLDTRMYIYDVCPSFLVSSPEGALTFSDEFGNCEPGSGFSNLLFEAGKQYYIRVEMVDDEVPEVVAVKFVSKTQNLGCIDPLSCNYNPFANTDDGSCNYDNDCGPDLAISQEKFANSLLLDKYILEDTCLLNEKCVTGLGTRDIVRFTTAIYNIGTADYIVGYPDTNSGGFSRENCHEHWHQLGYAEYILYKGEGQPEPIGFKNGFCVLDIGCDSRDTKYHCGYMGITAGCYDEYTADIDCQWIDLTDVEDGDYTMVARINWGKYPDARGQEELDYENNWAQVCINLDRSSGELVLKVNDTCPEYRDCLGVAFGPAELDCAGICGGMEHFGDIDMDGEIANSDIEFYLSEIGNGVIEATNCSDLDGNGVLTVYDASLLEECLSEYNPDDLTHQHCLFPAGIENTSIEATLGLLDVDLEENTIVVGLENLNTGIKAVQFRMSGIDKITKVEDLTGTGLSPHWSKNLDVLMLTENLPSGPESSLVKIFYEDEVDSEICISEIVDIINTSNQKILGNLSGSNCWFNTGIGEVRNNQGVVFHPNPVTDKLYIDTKGRTDISLKLYTINGLLVKEIELNPKHQLDLSNFDDGLYLAQFSDGTNSLLEILNN